MKKANAPLTESQLEKAGQTALATIQAVKITSQAVYLDVIELVKRAKSFKKETKKVFGPMKDKAYAAYKEILAQYAKIDEPFDRAEAYGKSLMLDWERRQQAIADEKARKAAAALEALPADAPVPAALARPIENRAHAVEGVTYIDNWQARVVDLSAFFQYLMNHPELIPDFVTPDLSALSQKAKLTASTESPYPGVEFVNERYSRIG